MLRSLLAYNKSIIQATGKLIDYTVTILITARTRAYYFIDTILAWIVGMLLCTRILSATSIGFDQKTLNVTQHMVAHYLTCKAPTSISVTRWIHYTTGMYPNQITLMFMQGRNPIVRVIDMREDINITTGAHLTDYSMRLDDLI
jgi:hypothetical protein